MTMAVTGLLRDAIDVYFDVVGDKKRAATSSVRDPDSFDSSSVREGDAVLDLLIVGWIRRRYRTDTGPCGPQADTFQCLEVAPLDTSRPFYVDV